MKILIVSSAVSEGAGGVARDLAEAFDGLGDKCTILTGWPPFNDQRVVTLHRHNPAGLMQKLIRWIKFLRAGRGLRAATVYKYHFRGFYDTITRVSAENVFNRVGFVPDAVVVLFNVNLVSYKILNDIAGKFGIPVIVYAMDMREFTGGCHYAWDCRGYEHGCSDCPALVLKRKKKIAAENIKYRCRYIGNELIRFCAASSWQYDQAQRAKVLQGKKPHKVLLGMNTNTFKPGDKTTARRSLGLPEEQRVILFGAMSVAEERKGFKYLLEALNLLNDQTKSRLHLAILGRGTDNIPDLGSFSHTTLGNCDYALLPTVYTAADAFVCSSIEDSGPSMINQSILCGTPVVSFDMGVSRDLVFTGKTGYRAKLMDSEDLAKGIAVIVELSDDEQRKMGAQCRNLGLETCDILAQAQKLKDLLVPHA